MNIKKLKINKKTLMLTLMAGLFTTPVFASVSYQCINGNDNQTCKIWQGNTADTLPSNVINQVTIDNILNSQKKSRYITIEITPGNYTMYPFKIHGVNNLTFKLDQGVTMTAISKDQKEKGNKAKSDPWKSVDDIIIFENCNNLKVIGAAPSPMNLIDNRPESNIDMPSVIDGNGADWWRDHEKDNSIFRPPLIDFSHINGLTIEDLEFRNSPRAHVSVRNSKDITIHQVLVHSEPDSPNTDGLNIGSVQNVQISDSTIYNGDDSVAINSDGDGDHNININNMDMYFGHGVSIGSHVNANVEGVVVQNVIFHNTTNGLRIKTLCDGGVCTKSDGNGDSAEHKGKEIVVSNIQYKNISMYDVKNPIIYDFSYGKAWSKVQVNNITYTNVTSVSSNKSGKKDKFKKYSNPATLLCEEENGCKNIVLNNVSIDSYGLCRDIDMSVNNHDEDYKNKINTCLDN